MRKREKKREKIGGEGVMFSTDIKVKGVWQGGRRGVDSDRICMLD